MSRLHLLWRITYHSLYYLFSLILLLLLCATPADTIRLAYINRQRFHILIIICCLSVAVAAVVCIYFFRIYVTRSALASIPRPYIPVEKGDMHKSMRKVIAYGLSRSAAIAFDSRPRVLPPASSSATASNTDGREEGSAQKNKHERNRSWGIFPLEKAATAEDKMGITLPPHSAVWGEIEHYGWASPNSPDLPNLHYCTVIQELPNLIEAKALTLAPPAPESQPGHPILEPEAIGLLQKQDNLGLRQYLAHLARLGVLAASRTTADFLSSYEYARYSTRPISNARFRELMHLFAEILRTMQPLDPSMLVGLDDDDDDGASSSSTESDDIDNDAPRESNPSTPRSTTRRQQQQPPPLFRHRQRSNATTYSTATSSSSGSGGNVSHISRPMLTRARNSSPITWTATYRTAPTTPKSRRTGVTPSPTSSVDSFAQTRAPYSVGATGSVSSSSPSVRSAASGGSVIRLSERAGAGELPYVLTLTETRQ
ncbi:unnamed protein product [Discula destructiva]